MALIDIIRDYYAGYLRCDFDNLAISPDITHTSPLGIVQGKDQYMQSCTAFAAQTERIDIVRWAENGNTVCVETEIHSKSGGPAFPTCEWYTVENGLITDVRVYFDASGMK